MKKAGSKEPAKPGIKSLVWHIPLNAFGYAGIYHHLFNVSSITAVSYYRHSCKITAFIERLIPDTCHAIRNCYAC